MDSVYEHVLYCIQEGSGTMNFHTLPEIPFEQTLPEIPFELSEITEIRKSEIKDSWNSNQ